MMLLRLSCSGRRECFENVRSVLGRNALNIFCDIRGLFFAGLKIDEASKKLLEVTGKELVDEKKLAYECLQA